MNRSERKATTKGAEDQGETYILRLFTADDEPNSKQAKENLKRLEETYLKGPHKKEIVDVLKDFQTALDNNVLVTPCLILDSPLPKVTVFGNLSNIEKVLASLRLK
ncbi:MAG: circadian clock protein KaiB [Fidelibacterota bacterium]|nr:MAG: circadian clock protein KaiB [Candidatus Neomarinimicrobiota bacterium]